MVHPGQHMHDPPDTTVTDQSYTLQTGAAAIEQIIADVLAERHSLRFTGYVLRLSKNPNPTTGKDPWRRFTHALLTAPDRGVDCRLTICNPRASGSMGRIDEASRHRLAASGWRLRSPPPAKILHAKTYLFGSGTVWIGSHNLTRVSWTENYETSIRTNHQTIYQKVHDWQTALWTKSNDPWQK